MVFVALGLYIYKNHASQINGALNRTVHPGSNSFSYMRLDSKSDPKSGGNSLLPLSIRDFTNPSMLKKMLPTAFLILCIGLQTGLSSTLWNYSLITFSKIFETDMLTGE